MQRLTLHVLGERILLGDSLNAHDARYALRLGHPLLLDEQLKRAKAPAAGGNLEHPRFVAVAVENRANAEALYQRAAGDILSQFLN